MSQVGRILVVDDETNARSALAELLREEGYSVETAADGFKALPKLEEFSPDVLVTDLKMPGLDGMGLLRKSLCRPAAARNSCAENNTGRRACVFHARRGSTKESRPLLRAERRLLITTGALW